MEERQLNIFKGPRQKGELPPPPKETALHIALASLIKQSICEGWSFTHFANGGYRDPRTAALFKAMGVTPGFPDLVFFGPGQKVFFLELKRIGGRLSAEQQDIRDRLMRSGFTYMVANNINDATTELWGRGIIRARVSA